jgi:hypothetical protein
MIDTPAGAVGFVVTVPPVLLVMVVCDCASAHASKAMIVKTV